MKLPWDKRYLKISFHVIISVIIILFLWLIITDLPSFGRILCVFFGGLINVLAPLFFAVFIAFIFDPLVEFFQRLCDGGKIIRRNGFRRRKAGTIITYGVLFSAIAFGIYMLISKIGSADISSIAEKFSGSIEDLSDLLVLLQVRLAEMGILDDVDTYYREFLANITDYIEAGIYTIILSLGKAGNFFINLIVGFTAAFYFLAEKDKIFYKLKEYFKTFLSNKSYSVFSSFCADVNQVFSGYIRGQIIDAFIMAVLISTAFYFAGIQYAVVIGIVSGLLNIIPYVGATVAVILSASTALLSGTPLKALYAAIIVIVLQQVDSMYISPKIVGRNVRLHPVLVILSIAIFGKLFGIWGMLFAVPITAILKIIVNRLYIRKKRMLNKEIQK